MDEDRRDQFLILVERICETACLAGFTVEIRTHAGTALTGIPSTERLHVRRPGSQRVLEVAGSELTLEEIAEISVGAPEAIAPTISASPPASHRVSARESA